MKTFGVVNLGCFKNLVDSQAMMGILIQHGFFYTDDLDRAEIIIINTCGFITPAKRESLQVLKEIAEKRIKGLCKKMIVVGCLVQREQNHLKELVPKIDCLLGVDDIPHILQAVKERAFQSVIPISKMGAKKQFETPHWVYDGKIPRVLTGSPHYSFIKIAEGCDHICSFCTIPFIKGHYRSRTITSIIQEAHGLAVSRVKELILISQDTSFYGYDRGKPDMLIELLTQLLKIAGFHWIRFLYLYPDYVTEKLLQFIAENARICKYFDIPLQHCSTKILKLMKRAGNRHKYVNLINRIRTLMPDAAIRTSVIVGFPGETPADFQELLSFCREIEFDSLAIFTYYDEKDTASYQFSSKNDYREKVKRKKILFDEQRTILARKNKRIRHKVFDAIIDEKRNNYYLLRYQGMAPEIDGIIKSHFLHSHNGNDAGQKYYEPGDFVKVMITGAKNYIWRGKITS